ncbi:Short-chain dehydrogenase/reductase family protein [Mycena kentingensis (nom. inval.)]|nr:Short-chain dehydrogenase/reductase family protein [Mycena kentingensis (nom. inval.)]
MRLACSSSAHHSARTYQIIFSYLRLPAMLASSSEPIKSFSAHGRGRGVPRGYKRTPTCYPLVNIFSNMSFPIFNFNSTAEDVASAFAEQIKGKTVLVTGTALTSIGFTTARAIAQYAGLVIVTGRSADRLKLVKKAIESELPSARIRPLVLDLSSQAAVRKAAAEVNAYAEPLDVLIHNAAAEMGSFVLTEDGVESQFAAAQVSPFLFTKLVLPKLLASPHPRVIFVSSVAHTFGTIEDWDVLLHPARHEKAYTPMGAYAHAKIANVLMAKELTKRSGGRVQSFSLHPGAIHTSADQNPGTMKTLQDAGIYTADGKPNPEKMQWKTRNEGAATTIAAAFDPRLEGKGGAYLCDSALADDQVSEFASNMANAKKLWDVTEEILGEKFVIN